jgi:hypothetical protein
MPRTRHLHGVQTATSSTRQQTWLLSTLFMWFARKPQMKRQHLGHAARLVSVHAARHVLQRDTRIHGKVIGEDVVMCCKDCTTANVRDDV